jgi:hypothetical protein
METWKLCSSVPGRVANIFLFVHFPLFAGISRLYRRDAGFTSRQPFGRPNRRPKSATELVLGGYILISTWSVQLSSNQYCLVLPAPQVVQGLQMMQQVECGSENGTGHLPTVKKLLNET